VEADERTVYTEEETAISMSGSSTVIIQRIASALLAVGFAGFAAAQNQQPLPSRQEIDELISKADQKIDALSVALMSVRQDIESTTPDLWKNQMGNVSTAHQIIQTIREKGPSVYRLVALNTTLDDVSRASLLSIIVAVGEKSVDRETQQGLAAVTSAELGCYDISELLGHVTLRLIQAEEHVINSLPAN
jgi:hypothetical protein